jgi:hypothetical protein
MTFLHEYTHLLGQSGLYFNHGMIESRSNCFYIALGNPQANPPVIVPQVALFPKSYEFPSANQLVRQSGTQVALTNADSYALLGVALLLTTCETGTT